MGYSQNSQVELIVILGLIDCKYTIYFFTIVSYE